VHGYKDALKKYPDIKLLDSQPADFNREKGMVLMENRLRKYKKIAQMFYRQSMLFVGFLKEKDPDGFKKLILAVQSGV
jgi:ribose transport system substrate-binding protein